MTRWNPLPAELYALVEQTPATVLLESAAPADFSAAAPVTRLFSAPLRVLTASQPAELPTLFAEIQRSVDTGLFAAGYFTYECGGFFEPKAARPARESQPAEQPLAWFGIYSKPRIFDHETGMFLDGGPRLPAQCDSSTEIPGSEIDCAVPVTEHQYAERIEQILDFICAGDVYQLNFTIPVNVHATGSVASLYRRLHGAQPAPYSAFLHTQPSRHILSLSPELFFRVDEADTDPASMNKAGPTRRITTRPMKGTAARGRTTAEDRAQAQWLANDAKNRAENVMIVDLLRNDLGRLCNFGSVRVENLFAVERYPTLWQMTSTVTGELRPEAGFQDIFRALFPCGSVTGAPKIRAMQLLAELEERPRGVYTGAIGFFSKEQTVFNVAIRTLTLNGDAGTMGVGSGIVIDSKAGDEWRECLLKAEFLTGFNSARAMPGSFSLVESLLRAGGYPLLELHLDRMEDSAVYFALPFDRGQAKAVLEEHAAEFKSTDARHRKVRLLLNADGSLSIASELIAAPTTEPLRVRIAAERTNQNDPMYFHKTTHRPLYVRELHGAQQAGYDEVLFLNLHGEVTEAAIHNVFIEKDGRLLTPPIECGVLPGVQRRHILATRPNAEERVLSKEDLRAADAVYLSNAVRGLRRAIIDWESD